MRIKNAKYLSKHLSKIPGIIVPEVQKNSTHVFHQYTIRIRPEFPLSRDEVVQKLTDAGIGTAIFYPLPINAQKLYRDLGYKINTPIAEQISKEVISLPVHPGLKVKDLNYVIKILQDIKP